MQVRICGQCGDFCRWWHGEPAEQCVQGVLQEQCTAGEPFAAWADAAAGDVGQGVGAVADPPWAAQQEACRAAQAQRPPSAEPRERARDAQGTAQQGCVRRTAHTYRTRLLVRLAHINLATTNHTVRHLPLQAPRVPNKEGTPTTTAAPWQHCCDAHEAASAPRQGCTYGGGGGCSVIGMRRRERKRVV